MLSKCYGMRMGWDKKGDKPEPAMIGETCTTGKSAYFLAIKKALGQAKAEEMVPQTPCDSGLRCDCVVTTGTHELGTWETRKCKCVNSSS